MQERLSSRHVVLLGVGHTNAHVVRMWGMNPVPDADLTCISEFGVATYSGMLPAVLARQRPRHEMEIDVVRLCRSVNARLILGQVTGIDHSRREILFNDRPAIPFDVLSVGIGSVPTTDGVAVRGSSMVAIKPMQTFQNRLAACIASLPGADAGEPLRLTVVGSGVAGVEIAFCAPAFIRTLTQRPLKLIMVTRSDSIMPGVTQGTRRRTEQHLQHRGIEVTCGRTVTAVEPGHVVLDDGTTRDADVVIWATGAAAPPILRCLDLPTSQQGFLLTDASLQCLDTPSVFAVGDSGTIQGAELPKAGVYAVRQGPVLWENLQRALSNRPLTSYVPQRSFLKLINLGDGTAIGQWKGLSFSGGWVWKLKDSIDTRFMEMYRPKGSMLHDGLPMQCRGCGCKLEADALDRALANTVSPDDAAEIGGDDSGQLLASTDFFSSPFDDPWLFGRVAALHAASDLVASGAAVTHALANVVVPEGSSRDQQRVLRDFLSGARREFSAMRAEVVGGHTIVGPRFEAGFTVFGRTIGTTPLRKNALRAGDQLWLTKSLGIGILLAAHMRSRCSAAHYESVIRTMLQPQHALAAAAVRSGVAAATDVTGFGLAGHLLEMLHASRLAADLWLTALPLLDGVAELVSQGIESSLAPGNRVRESQIAVTDTVRADPRYAVLFDPQTCGGLLLGVPQQNAADFQSAMVTAGFEDCVRIGEVRGSDAATALIAIR
ncbi:MAG: selenide, water dikinase SelD [Planctomycetaceae bacterium]